MTRADACATACDCRAERVQPAGYIAVPIPRRADAYGAEGPGVVIPEETP